VSVSSETGPSQLAATACCEARNDAFAGKKAKASGSFHLPLPPEEAFDLFTAEGEKLWVPNWKPQILGPTPQSAGLVFLTWRDEICTIWTVVESDKSALRHCYSRVTLGAHAGLVRLSLTPDHGGSRVCVTYDMTALPGSLATALDDYRARAFETMLSEWAALLREFARSQRKGVLK
jgi:hypothetical protein